MLVCCATQDQVYIRPRDDVSIHRYEGTYRTRQQKSFGHSSRRVDNSTFGISVRVDSSAFDGDRGVG